MEKPNPSTTPSSPPSLYEQTQLEGSGDMASCSFVCLAVTGGCRRRGGGEGGSSMPRYSTTGSTSTDPIGSPTNNSSGLPEDSRTRRCSAAEASGGLPRGPADLQHPSGGEASLPRVEAGDEGVRSRDREYRPAPTSEHRPAPGLLPPQGGAAPGLRFHAQWKPRQVLARSIQGESRLGAEGPDHQRCRVGPSVSAPRLGEDGHPPRHQAQQCPPG
ncbi:L-type lectin-domain containing receptor kinase IV.1-like [Iris pallida]|uniref:L-type lectin-domain containing receptor kinase IV.1-like n=1 Tax=Iris pallida TaxID=29817 RepID=A0AAX6HSK7_IRIPA|nr:L-type lectin-domain containing receptor kinase IV.1-like [Iris pallida]